MGWEPVIKEGANTDRDKREKCSEILIKTASTTHQHLTEVALNTRLKETIGKKPNGKPLIELWLYKKTDGEPYSLVIAFDLSLRRRLDNELKPTGSITQHQWGISVGRDTETEGITLTDQEAYDAVKDKCKIFLDNLDKVRKDELHIRVDAESKINLDNKADELFIKFLSDRNISTLPPKVYPVGEYRYYQRRDGTTFPDVKFIWSQEITDITIP